MKYITPQQYIENLQNAVREVIGRLCQVAVVMCANIAALYQGPKLAGKNAKT